MQIREVMTRSVRTIGPGATVREAAHAMAELDVGMLPVAEGDRLVGVITDRDIALRAIGAGKDGDCAVGDVMSPEVLYCYDDEEVDDLCRNLADVQVRRLPVVNRDKRLIGIVSLADLASNGDPEETGAALEGITRPGGAHSQSLEPRV